MSCEGCGKAKYPRISKGSADESGPPEPPAPPRPRLAAHRPPGQVAGHLPPHPRGAAHARRLDLATGQIIYRIRERKRWREFLVSLKLLRARWPGQKLYLIAGDFFPHKHPEVTGWAATNNVELVFLLLMAELDRTRIRALRYFALNGTDHHTHAGKAR
jgi:hypothetical protein